MAEVKNIQQVNESDFDAKVVNAGKPAFVDFWAPWCGPCRIIGPIIEELAPGYDGKVVIAKVNVDDNPSIAQKYQITSIPTLMMFKDGQVVDRAIGVLPKSELQRFIDRNS
jgi:thioredoxin 1